MSGVFSRSNRDGSKRLILKLKRFKIFVGYKHFKIKSPQNVLELIRQGVYMASNDRKDAFYSIPVHKNHQVYLTVFVEEYLNLYVCQMDMDQPCEYLQNLKRFLIRNLR